MIRNVFAVRRSSRWLSWICTALLILGLSGCGGGTTSTDDAGALADGRARALSAAQETPVSPSVVTITKVGETRVGRTVYDYVFKVTVLNGSVPQQDIVATLTTVGPGTSIVDGVVSVGELPAGASATPADTITLRHDRLRPFNQSAMVWQITGKPFLDPIVVGAQYMGGVPGQALLGQPFTGKARVALNDKRNAITGYAVSTTTVGGATPMIDSSGVLTWQPNDADFAGTTNLRLVVSLAVGSPAEFSVPLRVVNERLVHEEALPPSAGSIADPQGRYLIKVEPESLGSSMSGTLSIHEIFDGAGKFIYEIRVPSTAGVKVTVIYAPNLNANPGSGPTVANSASRSLIRQAASSPRNRTLAGETANGLTADIGASLGNLSGKLGQVANDGQVNVYTTRSASFVHKGSVLGLIKLKSAPPDQPIYQIDGNCDSEQTCEAIVDESGVRRSPIILIHGFTPGQHVGGGSNTWGTLAETLHKRSHPVFELRWNTYMRFEEAAGVLAQLAVRVATITKSKVSVVAHSFGGIVAHQTMMGKGIRYNGNETWVTVPVDNVFQRLITLGSPLSGISYWRSQDLELTVGRDGDDGSIDICEAITCFQAGSDSYWGPVEINQLVNKVSAIDSQRTGLSDRREGESIRTLHKSWNDNNGHRVPFTTIVSLKKRPFADNIPDMNANNAHDLGDGLISMIGQAVVPKDFSANPYGPQREYNFPGTLGANFLSDLDARFAGDTEYRERNGRDYYFALKAAHSCLQIGGGADCVSLVPIYSSAYLIANYPKDGVVKVEGYPNSDHPLKSFIVSSNHLSEPRVPYGVAPPLAPPVSVVFGIIVQNGQPAAKATTFQLERRDGRTPVGDVQVVSSSATDGKYSFDAGAILGLSFPNQALNLADFEVVFRVGNSITERMMDIRKQLTASLDLGAIDVSLVSPAALITASGYVVGPLPASSPIAGATVWLIRGENQTVDTLRQVRDTNVSRRLISGPDGRYTTANIETGTYSMLVSKLGFVDTYRGNTYIDANGIAPVVLGAVSSFVPTGSLRTARIGHTATRLLDGRVLITGGDSSGNTAPYLRSAEIYSPATGTFSPTGDMTSRRGSHTATLLPNGKVLITGGFTEYKTDRTLSSAEIYDPTTGSFRAIVNMNVKRVWHTATPLNDGRVLVVGGFDNQVPIFGTYLNSAEVFDPNTETFALVGGMAIPRIWFAATKLADGKVLIAGGSDGYGRWTGAAEVFNPNTLSFASVGSLATPRWIHQAALMNDGRVLFPGGNVPGDTSTTSAEVYIPATQSFSRVGDLSNARGGASVTPLSGGGVLVAGGGGSTIFDSAEIFAPGTNTFSGMSGRMISPRYNHSATLLSDGRVLLVGGSGATHQALSTAEVYASPGLNQLSLFDEFNGTDVDSTKWTRVLHPTYSGTSASVSGGELRLAVGAWLHTQGKATFTGRKIVLEGVMGDTEASILLMDSFDAVTGQSAGTIMGSDTLYRGWGFSVQAGGRYPIVGTTTAGSITVAEGQNVLVSWDHNAAMLYRRLTIDGDIVTFERGNSPDAITLRLSTRMAASIAGRPMTLVLGTGVGPYTPGRFQWIKATVTP